LTDDARLLYNSRYLVSNIAEGSKVRPYNDVDDAAAPYERGVVMHDRGESIAAEELWHKAADAGRAGARRNLDELTKRSPQELANP
jgi:hypothetical protein